MLCISQVINTHDLTLISCLIGCDEYIIFTDSSSDRVLSEPALSRPISTNELHDLLLRLFKSINLLSKECLYSSLFET